MEIPTPGSSVAFDPADGELVERAALALGRLDGLALVIPDPKLHAWLAIRKEAVLSSHVDGVGMAVSTTALLRHEDEPGAGPDGVGAVAALAAALDLGASRLRGGSTLSAALLREVHATLRPSASASPSPASPAGNASADGLAELEALLRGPGPVLLRTILALGQVERHRLFGDESGCLGRALIPLLLYGEGVLQLPLLVPSAYLRRHRDAGRRRLATGDSGTWVRFGLEGLATAAEEAVVTIRSLLALFETDRESIQGGGRGAAELRVFDATRRHPVATVARLAEVTGLPAGAARDAVTALERLRILREREGDVFAYTAYCDVLDEGTVLRPQ